MGNGKRTPGAHTPGARTPGARLPGAQPKNMNALKHGFYSKQFKEDEIADLDNLLSQGLDNEIRMLRIMARRLFEYASGCTNPHDMALSLSTLGIASVRLANLMRSQKAIIGETGGEVEIALKQALSELKAEWNLR